jgi:N-acetylglutamate synthase/N-acetylornithine aminotransferase
VRKVLEGNRVKIYNEKGELMQEREATLEDLKEYIDSKLQELLTQYEIEITVDLQSGRGVGRWRKRS